MDRNLSVCGLLKQTIVSFCKENYSSSGITVSGLICISFQNSLQQHIVQIHDSLSEGKSYNESKNLDQDEKVSKCDQNDYERCCYACLQQREDNPKKKTKVFEKLNENENLKFSRENSKLFKSKAPPPLFNSQAKGYSEFSRLSDGSVCRVKKNKSFQDSRKQQFRQNMGYSSMKTIYRTAGNTTGRFEDAPDDVVIFEQENNHKAFQNRDVHATSRNIEADNQILENKVSRAVRIENEEESDGNKVVIKLELMDNENDENYSITINENHSKSPTEFEEPDEFGDAIQTFNEGSSSNDKTFSQDMTSEMYINEDVKFDIDNLAHNLTSQADTLQSEEVSPDSVTRDISCIVAHDENLELVPTNDDRNLFHSTSDWELGSRGVNYTNGAYSLTSSDTHDEVTNQTSSHFHPEFPVTSRVVNHDTSTTNRSFIAQNNTSSRLKFNFPNKIFSRKLLPLQRLRQFGNTKSSLSNSQGLNVFTMRRSKIKKVGSDNIEISTKEKQYHCKHCGLGFTTTGNRTRHERTTCGKSVYKCDFCEALFSRSDSRSRHMLMRHGISGISVNS